MLRSPLLRGVLGVLGVVLLLGVLRFKPWQPKDNEGTPASQGSNPNRTRQELTVGFLPVT